MTVKNKRIINRFGLLRLSPQLEAGIVLDAPQYDLEYETFSNKLRFRLQSNRQKSDRSEYSLIRWMNELRDVVLKPWKSKWKYNPSDYGAVEQVIGCEGAGSSFLSRYPFNPELREFGFTSSQLRR